MADAFPRFFVRFNGALAHEVDDMPQALVKAARCFAGFAVGTRHGYG